MKSIAYLGLLAGIITTFNIESSLAKEFDDKIKTIHWNSDYLKSSILLNKIKDTEEFISFPRISELYFKMPFVVKQRFKTGYSGKIDFRKQ